jgi:menaquinone-dependent protoporphyrinogen oxidase
MISRDMARILILYSTTDGHTLEICQAILDSLQRQGHRVKLFPVDDPGPDDPQQFDTIVIGARIRYGKHQPCVYDFISRHEDLLRQRASAFFSVNVVARKAQKNTPETNPYMQKFLRQVNWRPDRLAVFAGKIDYQKYGFFDRMMIRLIMYLTNGPTDPLSATDFTDWQQVDDFARVIGELENRQNT